MNHFSFITRASLAGILGLFVLVQSASAQSRPNSRRSGGGTIQEPSKGKILQPSQPIQPSAQPAVAPPVVGQPVALSGESNLLMREAETQLKAGQLDEADRLLRIAIVKDPTNQSALSLLRQVQEQREETVGKITRDKLRAIVLDEIQFSATSLESVLNYLSDESQRLSSNRSPINFVLKAPDDHKFTPVTLRMKKIPMFDVLKYVCDLSGATFLLDDARVTVVPRLASPPPSPVP